MTSVSTSAAVLIDRAGSTAATGLARERTATQRRACLVSEMAHKLGLKSGK